MKKFLLPFQKPEEATPSVGFGIIGDVIGQKEIPIDKAKVILVRRASQICWL